MKRYIIYIKQGMLIVTGDSISDVIKRYLFPGETYVIKSI